MPSEQPNTRRIEELKDQIKRTKDAGGDTAAMEAELESLQGKGQAQGQGRGRDTTQHSGK